MAQALKMNSALPQMLGRVKKKSSIPAGIKNDANIVPKTRRVRPSRISGRAVERGGIAITAIGGNGKAERYAPCFLRS